MSPSVASLIVAGMAFCLASCATPDRTGYRIAAIIMQNPPRLQGTGLLWTRLLHSLSLHKETGPQQVMQRNLQANSGESISVRTVPGQQGSLVEPMVAVLSLP